MKEKVFKLVQPLHFALIIILTVSTIFLTKFSIIYLILSEFIIHTSLSISFALYIMSKHRNLLMELIDWCRQLDGKRDIFHKILGDSGIYYIDDIRKKCFKVLKILRFFIISGGVSCGTLSVVVGYFLPENIHSKFTLPIPLYLPFKNQKTWLAFGTTVFLQTLTALLISALTTMIFEVFYCIIVHILGVLDIIKEIVGKMKNVMKIKAFRIEQQENSTVNLCESTLDSMSLTDWLKIIVDLIVEVNDKILIIKKLFSHIIFQFEICALNSIQLTGLVLMIIKQQRVFAIIFGISVSTLFFMFCLVNEIILEKFKIIKDELYDIPWYELSPKDRKVFLIAMHCDKIQSGFSASGFHDVTLQRFSSILKSAYSNTLVLRDIIKK